MITLNNKQKLVKIFQVILDFFFIILLLKGADYFYHLSTFRLNVHFPYYPDLFLLLFSTIVIFFLFITSSYQKHLTIYSIEEEVKIVKSVLFSIILFIISSFLLKQIFLNRLFTVYAAVLMIIGIIISRYLFGKITFYFYSRNRLLTNVLIYGAGVIGYQLYEQFKRMPQFGYNVVGFIDDFKSGKTSNPGEVLGSFSDISNIVRKHNISEIIIAMPSIISEKSYHIINKCNELNIKYRFVPNLYKIMIQKVKIDEFGGIPLISYKEPKYDLINIFIKRTFDFIFSIVIMVISAPLWLIVAFIIKLDSKGPVLFKQNRVGKDGKEFLMYKFRTMYIDTPKYSYCPKSNNDKRITRIGRFLRRTSFDEFPQFVNVLIGDMSIVGPRPEMPFIVKEYLEVHKERLKVKPGITGFWQISPYRSELIHENIEYDLYYIYNQSFILDLVIIIKTLFFAMKGV